MSDMAAQHVGNGVGQCGVHLDGAGGKLFGGLFLL